MRRKKKERFFLQFAGPSRNGKCEFVENSGRSEKGISNEWRV